MKKFDELYESAINEKVKSLNETITLKENSKVKIDEAIDTSSLEEEIISLMSRKGMDKKFPLGIAQIIVSAITKSFSGPGPIKLNKKLVKTLSDVIYEIDQKNPVSEEEPYSY